MKLHEVLDEAKLRGLMAQVLLRAGYKPYFAEFAGDTAMIIPLSDGAQVRLRVLGNDWRASMLINRRAVKLAPRLAPDEVIPWIETLEYSK